MSSPAERDTPASGGLLHAKWWQVSMIGLGTAAVQLDSAVNIAFPAITAGFALSIGDIQWVVICYVLAYASLLLALGRIGDTIGHARVFRIGLIWSAASLLLVACAPNFASMLAFRVLQGIGAALVLSCGAALAISVYGEERRVQALGVYTMMLALGLMVGPLLGGVLTAVWDWPAVFWFRTPVALAALLLLWGMPATPPRASDDRFDVLGAFALVLGLVAMLLAFNRMRELSAIWFAILSAAAFAAFITRERRAVRPIIAVDLLGRPDFALLNLGSVLAYLAGFSIWLLVPYLLARVPGYSVAWNGAILSAAAAGSVVAAPIAGRIVGWRISADRLAIAGAVGIGAGLLWISLWTDQTSTMVRVAGLFLQGVGLGLFQLAYSDIVTAALPLRDRGVAGSLVMLARMLGSVISASLILMVFEILNTGHGFIEAFQRTFQLAALLGFVSAGLLAISSRMRAN